MESELIPSIAYIIIAGLLIWVVIGSKGKYVLKIFAVVLGVWFSIALYYSMPTFLGYPCKDGLPNGSQVISIRIVEPTDDEEGAFYFWLNTKPQWKNDLRNMVNPFKIFSYTGEYKPRSYEMPYDRELHERLLEAKEEKKKVGGGWIQIDNEEEDQESSNRMSPDRVKFKIMNPFEILTKE